MNRRRTLLAALCGGALAVPFGSLAQTKLAKVYRIGLLSPFSPSDTALWHQAFQLGLRDLGWVEGKNISIEYRYAEGRFSRLPKLAAELVRLKVDVIVTAIAADALAAQKATRAIPIVMAIGDDPVAIGLIESLAHPGGNITGLTGVNDEIIPKQLEMLRSMAPKLFRAAVLVNPTNLNRVEKLKYIYAAAKFPSVRILYLEARTPQEIEHALLTMSENKARAFIMASDPLFSKQFRQIAELALKHRLLSVSQSREYAEAGGLISYGANSADMHRRAATYVDRILKGAKPADLPVEQPTKYELIINGKTAKALGRTIPPSLLAMADKVID
jgi:putative ABC transport system substrate-binding protein